MALFDRHTTVLRINYGKDSAARWVLWPVFAWRVVAPVPQDRKLNLFQKAVLGLTRAKVTSIKDLADQLLIAPDLAGLIVSELRNMAFLDYAGVPTERGLKQLDEIEEDPPDDMRVGHVLADVFSGKLWPRFLAGDLPIAEVELNEEGRQVLLSGSAGDPWKDRPFIVLPADRELVQTRPSSQDVLHAARRHRRRRHYDFVDDDRDVPRIQRVSFVDEAPQPYLFALRLRSHESGDWMLDDPFGHGEATNLRGQLEAQLDKQVGLRQWLSPLVGSDDTSPTLGKLQVEAAWIVEQRLTLAIRNDEAVRKLLVAMQRTLLEAEIGDSPIDKKNDVLVKAQRAVERTLKTVLKNGQTDGAAQFKRLAVSDKEYNRKLLDTIAKDLGFRVPLPERLSSVRRGKIQNAEIYGGGSLRPLVVLSLLCADRSMDHPLRRAGPNFPDLLHDLDELATARDRAAHDGPENRQPAVDQHVETAYKTVEVLLLQH